MRGLAAPALAVVFAVALSTRAEAIEIMSQVGARCVLHRDGRLLASVAIPPAQGDPKFALGLSEQVPVATGESHGDILVSCSLGDRATAQTVRFGRMIGDWVGPPCPAEAPPDCRSGGMTIDRDYPGIVRVFFDRPRSHYLQFVVLTPANGTPLTADLEFELLYDGAKPPLPLTFEQQQTMWKLSGAILLKNDAAAGSCNAPGAAVDKFDIVADNDNHWFEAPSACMTADANALRAAILCAAHRGPRECVRP